jgi:hypothetical protein
MALEDMDRLIDEARESDRRRLMVVARMDVVSNCGECSMRDDRGECVLIGKSTGDHAEDRTLHPQCPLRYGNFVLGLSKDASP